MPGRTSGFPSALCVTRDRGSKHSVAMDRFRPFSVVRVGLLRAPRPGRATARPDRPLRFAWAASRCARGHEPSASRRLRAATCPVRARPCRAADSVCSEKTSRFSAAGGALWAISVAARSAGLQSARSANRHSMSPRRAPPAAPSRSHAEADDRERPQRAQSRLPNTANADQRVQAVRHAARPAPSPPSRRLAGRWARPLDGDALRRQRRCRSRKLSVRVQANAAASGLYSVIGSLFAPTWVSLAKACMAL